MTVPACLCGKSYKRQLTSEVNRKFINRTSNLFECLCNHHPLNGWLRHRSSNRHQKGVTCNFSQLGTDHCGPGRPGTTRSVACMVTHRFDLEYIIHPLSTPRTVPTTDLEYITLPLSRTRTVPTTVHLVSISKLTSTFAERSPYADVTKSDFTPSAVVRETDVSSTQTVCTDYVLYFGRLHPEIMLEN